MRRSSSVLLLVAGLLVTGAASSAHASECMEEIPGFCVRDLRDECPVRVVC